MRLRDNFAERVVVTPDDYEWVASPAYGVDRMMLDRIGNEVARATTIVRFAPNSQFDLSGIGHGRSWAPGRAGLNPRGWSKSENARYFLAL